VDAAIIVAIVAMVSALASAGLSLWGQHRSATVAARREAEGVLAKYREPLIGAAYELQGRLYNILKLGFLHKYYVHGDDARRTYAVENTLYVVAQYFGWSEILRREIQFMSFSDSSKTRAVARRLRRIVELFQSDDPELGRAFLVWRGEQRAIGECMIDRTDDQVQCLGYAGFLDRRDAPLGPWLARLEADIDAIARERNPRLTELQHGLVDLVKELDTAGIRYGDDELQKA
jgi:hypothetical protein